MNADCSRFAIKNAEINAKIVHKRRKSEMMIILMKTNLIESIDINMKL